MSFSRGALKDFIYFNPREVLLKGSLANEVAMADIVPFQKYLPKQKVGRYNGGMKFRNGDTIVARITPCLENGKTAYIDILEENEVGFGSTEYIVLRAMPEKTIPEFVYYVATSSAFREKAISLMTGTSGRQRVQTDALMFEEMYFPSIIEQEKIVKILSSLDNKIRNNNRTNDNLHEMCLTIYRDLVNKTDAEKDLLKNHAKCALGGTPSRAKPEYWNGNINWINSGEINRFRILKPSETITDLGLQKTSTTLLPIGTTVLAITGATLGQVSRLEIESCANQSVIGVIPDDSLTNEFVYLNILENINDIIGRQTGGAQQHINKNDVETYEIIIPEPEKIAKFDKEIRPIFGRIRNNCLENERLTKLRDTLLPELLNGKIDVSNIDI